MTSFKEINLQVGSRLQMALQHGPVDIIYYTQLIGYLDGQYLIIKTPFENGLSVQMQVDEQVILRVLSGVDIVTLTCRVKTIFRAPHYYMHLSFPTDIKPYVPRSEPKSIYRCKSMALMPVLLPIGCVSRTGSVENGMRYPT